ncbi:RNA polymerase sigma-70 factor [Saccharicrinis fermentans]|uniref:Sigma-24 n=1 Tax=Saccharicrinis fermentans DSM 9555 = JCM 21142 TaxID=869213 RepID=W7YRV4_9BACT|nr:RNA polymerase sigma-70 factor [Saccharicrinis fermentans]GAF05144.1 sigma-24 [Saccharicrinis fermentans DSM 9555 = JCM 21142]
MRQSTTQNNDQRLFNRIKEGDEKAYEQLFKQYYVSLTAFANTLVHDLDMAESIVQNVFVKLWEKRRQYEITAVKSYLIIAVRNSCHNELKRVQHERDFKNTVCMEDVVEMVNYSDSGVMEHIAQVIELLPEQRRRIFKLNRLEGLKYREIAEKLSISPKTVEVQMGKALKFLRVHLLDLKKQVYYVDN